jgi:hypothetical protein
MKEKGKHRLDQIKRGSVFFSPVEVIFWSVLSPFGHGVVAVPVAAVVTVAVAVRLLSRSRFGCGRGSVAVAVVVAVPRSGLPRMRVKKTQTRPN